MPEETRTTPKSRFGATARELAVVFVGVLIALVVDAWWEDVKDRAELDRYLDGVAADLEVLEGLLEDRIASRQETMDSWEETIRLLASDEPVSDTVLLRGFGSDATALRLGTLDALLANADFEHLESDVRSALASYRAQAEYHRARINREQEQVVELMTAAIRESDRLGALGPEPQARPSISDLRRSREMLGIIRAYYVRLDLGRRSNLGLQEEVRVLLDVLEDRKPR